MNKSILAIAVASLLPYASFSHAQTSSDETVVVTASRFEQPLNDVIASTTVISKQEIEDIQAKSLVDVLKRVPGVEVAQTGGRGHSASIFMRGYNSDHVLILVDGVRIDTAAGGISFNHIPLGTVERVEVIRGAGGALYGSDAVAGVINIITTSTQTNPLTSVSLGVGSDKQREANFATVQKLGENGTLKLAGGFEETEGYDFKVPATGQDYGYESQNLLASYSHKLSETLTGSLSLRWFDSQVGYDSLGQKNYGYSENLSVTGEVKYQDDTLTSVLRANQQSIENIDYLESAGKANAGTQKNINLSNLQFLNQILINQYVTLGAGADWRKEKLDDDALSYGWPDALAGESRDTTGVYTSLDVNVNQLQVNASVRHDKHDKYDDYTTWSLGSMFYVTEKHAIRAAVGTAFKAPSYSDLTYNADLEPEKANNHEIGYIGDFELFSVEATYYNNDVDNLIIWYQGSPWYPLNVDAKLQGFELVTEFQTGFINHTVVAEFKDHKDSQGNKLARRADENYKWLVDTSYKDFDFNLTYTYTGERLGNPNESYDPTNVLSSVSLWDVSVGYWISPELVVRGRVDNLTDEEYQTAPGYNAPERRFFANVSYQF
ncbi:TonB-dependent receptor domain-containing protein [Vibrio sp. TRT 21S02]|uniref:TonB-dependent receptor domain-containing protein n=1 Tax=Vibrio sp. TRT 21S02 TaxID=3418507 RepID=UPI003CE88F3F